MHGTSLALCMIVRDGAAELPRALDSARGGWDQLIVVDTGSKDASVAIARRHGAEVHSFTAANDTDGTLLDFARARNVATSHARTAYWWWMDADDVAAPGTVATLRAAVAKRPKGTVLGVTDNGRSRWFRARLAPNDGRHLWRGAVHEWLVAPKGTTYDARLIFHHRPLPNRGTSSLRRNLRILRNEIAAGCATPRERFYLATTLQALGQGTAALNAWQHYLQLIPAQSGHALFARLYLARQHVAHGNLDAAAENAAAALQMAPRFAEAACLLGDVAEALGETALAVAWYNRALNSGPCPTGPLFHEPACYGHYPRRRLTALSQARQHQRPRPRAVGIASGWAPT